MKKMLIGLMLLFFIFGSYWVLLNNPPAKNENSQDNSPMIKIGVIYPQSGDGARFGAAAKVAAEIFMEDTQKKNPHYNYQFVWEDNQLKLPQTVSAAQKLINLDKVDVLITSLSNFGQAVNPIAEKNKTLHFSIATDPNVAKGKYNFIVATSAEKEAQKLVTELQKRRIKNVVAVVLNAQGPEMVFDVFKTTAEKNGIRISQIFKSNPGERDFRMMISRLSENTPEMIVVLLQMPEIDIFLRQLQQSKYKIPVTGIETFSYLRDKNLAEGMFYVDAAAPMTEFTERFKEVTGRDSTEYGEYFYTVLQILANTYQQFPGDYKTIPGAVAKKIIESGNGLDTAIGRVTVNAEGVFDTDAVIKEVNNGHAVVVKD